MLQNIMKIDKIKRSILAEKNVSYDAYKKYVIIKFKK